MTDRCVICHDPLGNEAGPTCGAEMCEVAHLLIKGAAKKPFWYDGDYNQEICFFCDAKKKPFSGFRRYDDVADHAPDCLHLRAKELLS